MIKKLTFNLLWTYWLAIAMAARDNPLRKLADAIEGLSSSVNSENPHLKISDVVQFGRLSTPSIFFLGIAFKFADLELQSKVLWSVNPYNYLQLISSITLMFLRFSVISLFFIIHYSNFDNQWKVNNLEEAGLEDIRHSTGFTGRWDWKWICQKYC